MGDKGEKVQTIFHACVADPVAVDLGVYQAWLGGQRAEEASARRRGMALTGVQLLRDTRDQYRTFLQLEHYLMDPQFLRAQPIVRLSPAMQGQLVERYYQFDAAVMRDLIGRRLTTKLRKDLDETSERTRLPLRSCQRQFDNLKRIYKKVEETEGSLREQIQYHFLLPKELAGLYARIVFLCLHRFETSRKKLAALSTDDFGVFSDIMLTQWSVQRSAELDPVLIDEVRDIRSLLLADRDVMEDYRAMVRQSLTGLIADDKNVKLDSKFSSTMRSLLTMGADLSSQRGLRDIFFDMTVLLESLKKLDIAQPSEIEHYFGRITSTFDDLQAVPKYHRNRLMPSWHRFLFGVKACLVHMFWKV